MKITDNSHTVLTHDIENETEFSITCNGKAFKALSDTLYKDKIGSIIREISSNAYDSHVMAGTPSLPFEVHLPDAFEPWFSVKDYGVGMSPTEITEVFTHLFKSTKEDNNNVIGAFGLGSKTPFSYTDQFTVVSIKDGIKSVYGAYTTESGIPKISLIESTPTDEHNGVEVSMSVKQQDYDAFKVKASEQLRFFKVQPVFTNADNFKIVNPVSNAQVSFEIPEVNFKMYNATHIRNWLIQGNIGYPFEINEFINACQDKELVKFVNQLRHKGNFVIEVPIGAIGVTVSREAVEYNEYTISSIQKVFEFVRDNLQQKIEEELKEFKTDWERAEYLNNHSLAGDRRTYLNRFGDNKPHVSGFGNSLVKYQAKPLADRAYSIVNGYGQGVSDIEPSKDYTFVVEDDCKYKAQRKSIVAGGRKSYVARSKIFLSSATLKTEEIIREFQKDFGDYPKERIKFLSEVEYVPPVRVKNGPAAKKTNFYVCNSTSVAAWPKMHESLTEYAKGKTIVVIPLDRLAYAEADGYTQVQKYHRFKEVFTFFDKESSLPTVIGINQRDYKKLIDNGAKTLKTWLQENEDFVQKQSYKLQKRKKFIEQLETLRDYAFYLKDSQKDKTVQKLLRLNDCYGNKYSHYGVPSGVELSESLVETISTVQGKFKEKVQGVKDTVPILKVPKHFLKDLNSDELSALASVKMPKKGE
jgi:hypothetical protein